MEALLISFYGLVIHEIVVILSAIACMTTATHAMSIMGLLESLERQG